MHIIDLSSYIYCNERFKLLVGWPPYIYIYGLGLGSWEGRMDFVESRLLSPNDRSVNPGTNKGDPCYQVPSSRVNLP